ncbi:MAG: hypothetical protein PHR53_02935 [Bacteroidales bacterium]|nr:hypothetical protein [Bacteroidales bacterium]
MNKETLSISILLIISLLFCAGCNKDPNPFVNHEQDITLVYGIINPKDTVHYVRIQKAFLTEGDAFVMANEEEANIYLDSLTVNVFVTEKNGSTPVYNMDWTLEKVMVHKTDSLGDFYWDGNPYPVFKFDYSFDLNKIEDKVIHLEITNNVSGKKIYASSNMMNSLSVRQPSGVNVEPGSATYQFGMLYTATSSKIEIIPTAYNKSYNVYMTFVYQEYDLSGNFTFDTLLYTFGSVNYDGNPSNMPNNPNNLDIYYNPSAFYTWLTSKIDEDENVIRIPRYFNFYFWSCSPEMYTYLDINSTSSGIIQDRPEYTNLTSSTGSNNVYGLFTCRFSRTAENMLVSPKMSEDLQTHLGKNGDIGKLNFKTSYP